MIILMEFLIYSVPAVHQQLVQTFADIIAIVIRSQDWTLGILLSSWLTRLSDKFCWLLDRGFCSSLLALSSGLLEWSYNLLVGYLQRWWSRRSRQKLQCLKGTHHHWKAHIITFSVFYWLHRPSHDFMGEVTIRGYQCQEVFISLRYKLSSHFIDE